jgi:hypothetical protein
MKSLRNHIFGGGVMAEKRNSTVKNNVHKFGISDKQGRPNRSADPYIPEEGIREEAICPKCQAIYKNKRWYRAEEIPEDEKAGRNFVPIECPACKKIAEGYHQGVVTLKGAFLRKHEEEILNLVHNEEKKSMSKNPLQRIMSIEREGDELVIKTTAEKLAEHLGRAVHKAQQGDLRVSWDDNHSFCRVSWEREA